MYKSAFFWMSGYEGYMKVMGRHYKWLKRLDPIKQQPAEINLETKGVIFNAKCLNMMNETQTRIWFVYGIKYIGFFIQEVWINSYMATNSPR